MEIRPIKQEYLFSVMKHTMRAVAEHKGDKRDLKYYFDDKLVSTKEVAGGEFFTDDDYIRDTIDNYRKNNTGVYADLFNRHTDKIFLTAKLMEVDILNYGFVIRCNVKITKGFFEMNLYTDDGKNTFSGKFEASDFSEVLEKMRLFTASSEDVNKVLAQNLNALSNDKIDEIIKWQEF